MTATSDWRQMARERAIAQFRLVLERAAREHVGHRWETGARACVLALLVAPALRPGEGAKAGAYRLFGCEATDDFPVTWDAGGVTLAELLDGAGVRAPSRHRPTLLGRLLAGHA